MDSRVIKTSSLTLAIDMKMKDSQKKVTNPADGFSDDLNELARQASTNKEAAQALMIHSVYRAEVKRQAKWICRRSHLVEAEDLEQEFFVNFDPIIEKFKSRSSILTWTWVVLRNLYYDHLRRERTGLQVVQKIGWLSKSEEAMDNPAREAALQEALNDLTELQKKILAMISQGKKYKTIAKELGLVTKDRNPDLQTVFKEAREAKEKLKNAIRGL